MGTMETIFGCLSFHRFEGHVKDAAQRKLIVDEAFEKFRRLGIRRVSLDEIARDLRISKKTIYQHFKDKEALVRACTEQLQGKVLPAAKAALSAEGNTSERLVAVWRALSAVPRHVSPDFIADLKAHYPHIWTEIDGRRQSVIAGLELVLREGVDSGELRPDIHPRVVVLALLAVLNHVLIPEVILRGEFSVSEAINTIMTLLLGGVLVNPPPRPGFIDEEKIG